MDGEIIKAGSDAARTYSDAEGCTFIANVLDVVVPLPEEVISGYFLKRPTEKELAHIRRYAQSAHLLGPLRNPWETEFVPVPGQQGHFSIVHLEQPQWRYYCIGFRGLNESVGDLSKAGWLLDQEIDLAFTFSETWHGGQEESIFLSLSHLTGFGATKSPAVIDAGVLTKWKNCFTKLKDIEKKFPEISRAVGMFHSLKGISPKFDLYVLGLFSVIECLTTHQPKSSDPTDSLTRQVRSKMQLLSGRFPTPIDYSCFDKGISPEKVWNKLYEFRSQVAHGAKTNFAGGLQPLKNAEVVKQFLCKVARVLISQALEEPQLFTALKEC